MTMVMRTSACDCRGGLILYRTIVNATWLKAGATLYVGAHVADHGHVSAQHPGSAACPDTGGWQMSGFSPMIQQLV